MKTPSLDSILIKSHPVELSKDLTVYVRPLTNLERDFCQAYARRAARTFRKRLEDRESSDHQLLIVEELEEYEVEQLSSLWVSNRLVTRASAIRRRSLEDRDQQYIPEPEGLDVTNAQMERYETEVEEAEEQREKSVSSSVISARDELLEEVKGISLDTLREEAIPALIDNVVNQEWMLEFNAQMVARATFTDEDCKKLAFKDAAETQTIKPEIFKKLTDNHYGLMIEPEALKN